MRKQRIKYQKRLNVMWAFIFAMMSFMAFAPLSFGAGLFFAVGALILPHMPLPYGILGEGTAGMSEEEKRKADEKVLLEKIIDEVKKKFDNLVESSEDLKLVKEIRDKIVNAKTVEELEAVKKSVEEIGLKLKAMEEKGKNNKVKQTLADAFISVVQDWHEKGELKKLRDNRSHSLTLETKTPATMTESNIDAVGSGSIPFTLADYEYGLTRVVRRNPFIMALVSIGRTVKKYIQWAEQANPDPDAADTTAEGAAKTQGDFDIVEKSCPVEKVTYFIKISREMLDDVDFIAAEIRLELVELIKLKADEQVLNGNGTPPNLKGILSFAQSFDAGPLTDTVNSANNFDVIRAAIDQIERATPNGPFMPNYIVMNPSDIASMELTKDSEDRYLLPPFWTMGGRMISGLPIVANIGMAVNNFLVGDFTKSNVRIREDIMIAMGYENDDFTKNLVTVLGEMRLVHYIKSNHVKAFVTGDFTSAKADLDPNLT